MDELDHDEDFKYDSLAFLKLRCLELAEEDRFRNEDRLAVAMRYFEWLMQDESQ